MITLILAMFLATLFLLACAYIATPCGWQNCPDCEYWWREDGGYTLDEPEDWDGCFAEKVCPKCENSFNSGVGFAYDTHQSSNRPNADARPTTKASQTAPSYSLSDLGLATNNVYPDANTNDAAQAQLISPTNPAPSPKPPLPASSSVGGGAGIL